MRIIFKEITIKNFKGITNLTVKFNPTLTNILGANHTGKTTTADAIHWVLFGKSSEGLTVFGIDPKDDNNQVIHHLDNSVTLVLEADGKQITLQKVRKENWIKPKGHDKEVLDSHSTECYIDGDKYTIKDYTKKISELCPESLFRTVTNPAYFPGLKADDQRALLIRMVGEKTSEEIAGDDEKFKELLHKMDGQDLKEYRQHLSYRMGEIKKKLDNIPSRISENQDTLANLTKKGVDFEAARKRVEAIDKEIANLDEQLKDSTAKADQDYDKRMAQRQVINGIKSQIADIEDEVNKRNRQAHTRLNNEISDNRQQVESIKRKIAGVNREIEDYNAQLTTIETRTEKFRKQWAEVENSTFEWDTSQETCPTCGQRLPEGDIEKLRSEAEDKWIKNHSKAQDDLDIEAARIKNSKTETTASLTDAKKRKADLENDLQVAQERLEGSESTTIADELASDNKNYLQLQDKLTAEQKKLDEIINAEREDTDDIKLTSTKAELMKERDGLRDDLAIEKEMKQRKDRIAELEEQMATLNQQLTNLEGEDFEAERFETATIEDLENRVNKLFTEVRFKMFETMLNGNTKPTCVLTMHGVPYQDLSDSEKINAGIDLINAMSRHTGTYAPITVDNAESVNEVLPSDSQEILLIVSRDPQLTVIA